MFDRAIRRPAMLTLSTLALSTLAFSGITPTRARAADTIELMLKDHSFTPAEVRVPANQRFRIEVINQDPTPAEFESSDLRVEKIVVAGGKIAVMAGPLRPGSYAFFDDYNPDSAKGTVIAAEQ